MTWVEVIRVTCTGLAALLASAFCVMYQVWTKGFWRDNKHGAHVMWFTGICALILWYGFLSQLGLIPDSWRPYAGSAIYLSIVVLFAWRFVLLWHDHRDVDKRLLVEEAVTDSDGDD